MTQEEIKVDVGSRVRMHFSLALPDGTEAVSTFGEDPIEFRMGDGTLSEGLELALYGLRPGTEQELRMDGTDVYGPRNPDLVQQVELARFPVGIEPVPGLIVAFSTPDGEELPGSVLSVEAGMAQVDFNHPLAGRELVFRCHILVVEPLE
jgi:FKBP-type peptidyl-prolyl cis-trans isomerase SlpA